MGFQGMRKSTMMSDPQMGPQTATPASIARRRRPHHREFPTGYSSAGCSPAEPASASPAAPFYLRRPPAQSTPGSSCFCLTHGYKPLPQQADSLPQPRPIAPIFQDKTPAPGQACMGLLVSTDLTSTRFVRSAGRVWFLGSSIINSPCWWGRWVCGRRRAFPRFSSWRGKRSRSAPPIVHMSTGRSLTECARRDQGFWVMIRGELAIRRGTSRHTLVFGGFHTGPNHDAVMRIGGKAPRRQAHSLGRRASHACLGSPPPRTIMGIAS
jgi:hypothetical protein